MSLRFSWKVIFPTIAFILMDLAILFPSPRHDRFDMLYIVVIAVIGREALFRGLLWDLVDCYADGAMVIRLPGTVWLTALAFGTMHLQYNRFQIHAASILQISYPFVLGIMLGTIRLRIKSILPAIFTHGAFNSLFNLLLAAF